MVTAIYSLSQVHGAELWLLFWLIGLLLYLGCSFLIKANRSKAGVKGVFIGLLLAEILIDVVWALIYYHNGSYINYGIGAVFGIAMWIPCLVITCACVTLRNKKRMTQNEVLDE